MSFYSGLNFLIICSTENLLGDPSSVFTYQIIVRCHAVGEHITVFRAVVALSFPVDPASLHITVFIKEVPLSA